VYPAMSVLQAVRDSDLAPADRPDFLWVRGEKGMEADLVTRANVPTRAIPAAGVHGVGLCNLPGNVVRLVRGFTAARKLLRESHPDAVLFTGGYVAVPVAVAARLPMRGLRRPKMCVYVPDIEPGLALKVVSRFSDHAALTVENSRQHFSRKLPVTVTGYPVRSEFERLKKDDARRILGLKTDLPVVGVFGGSSGARSINQAMTAILPELLRETQVIHISGKLGWQAVENARQELPQELAERYFAYSYLHDEMGAALAACDLAVSRAGASTLGEFPCFGLPAILVPYPYAWRYQRGNADYLVLNGAAEIILDDEMPEKLLSKVKALLADRQRLAQMSTAMAALHHPRAAWQIGQVLMSLARETG
jgi:UDP-N-acetylglucosamine:LPS N-acetylglucosamine transferase